MKTAFLFMVAALATHGSAQAQDRAAPHASRVSGVAYSVTMTRLTLTVESANQRGRIDIVAKAREPVVLMDSIDLAPLGEPGDYYLFDSTALILVQPKSRTFIAFGLRDGTYNFDNDRAGWPTEFTVPLRIQVDTLSQGTRPTLPPRPDGPIEVFWHLDVDWGLPTFAVISRGRLSGISAPAGEATVLRWVEPTFALDSLAKHDSTWFPSERLGLTSITPLAARPEAHTTNFTNKNHISSLRVAEVDRLRLTLPVDFAEVPRHSAPVLSAAALAQWHGLP